jgi:hypothetical protein
MASPVDINSRDETQQTARSGTSGITGGTAFNIAGINLGTQYPTSASTAASTGAGYDGAGISTKAALIIGGCVLAAALLFAWVRK